MIEVPDVLADSTSPSPAKVPPATDTVAPTRPTLSTSVTDSVGEIAVVAPSVKATLAAAATLGASLIAVMAIVLVAVLVLFVD